MIDQYDQLQESVKLYKGVLKGKAKSTQKLSTLGMKAILQKNKQIKHAKKQHLSKVIQARKLKIKVSDIFNIKSSSTSVYAASPKLQKKENNVKKSNDLLIKTAKMHPIGRKSMNLNTFSSDKMLKSGTFRIFSQKSLQRSNVQEDDGRINLFDNFTQQQLDQIQQDEVYYLAKPDLITVFRRYMLRKRQNNKDYSYEKFTIKPNHTQYFNFSEDNNFDKKMFILKTFKIDSMPTIQDNQTHLLTNPINFPTQATEKGRSRSLYQLRESKKSIYSVFKDKQAENKQKLMIEQSKKILGLRIDRNYFNGVAAEKRAIFKDKLHDLVVKNNKRHDERSTVSRQRIKTLREDLGKSIALAETIRSEFLKRRTANKKKS